MLISHRKQFIYTKTVKTAGTSVESYFEKYTMPEGAWEFSHARDMYVGDSGVVGYRGMAPEGNEWFNHMSADAIRARIGSAIWDRYFKFCVVRNPFEKLISAFHFFNTNINNENVNVIERFREWLASGQGAMVVDRDKYLIDSEVCIDYFIRFEDIHTGLKHVCERLDIPFDVASIPQLKIGQRNRKMMTSDYYDVSSVSIVEKIFEFELSYFGYGLEK